MKIDKIVPLISGKIQFVNEYIDLLTHGYNNNNKRITEYIEANPKHNGYNESELYKNPVLSSLIHSQMDIIYKINIGKALKNDIVSFDKLTKRILLLKDK